MDKPPIITSLKLVIEDNISLDVHPDELTGNVAYPQTHLFLDVHPDKLFSKYTSDYLQRTCINSS